MAGHRPVIRVCLLVSFLFGMLHIFSLFVIPLEAGFGAGRAAVSLSYSLAIVCLALAVVWGHRIYAWHSPRLVFCLALAVGALGLVLAATAVGLWQVWLGYGVLFGAANGIGYGFALQLSALAWPERGGWAMGLVTAAYALGASAAPPVVALILAQADWQAAFVAQAVLYAAAMPVVWRALAGSPLRFEPTGAAGAQVRWWQHRRLWLAYGLAVFAGLMGLSQASEIIRETGAGAALATAAPMVAALANLAGAVLGGWAADRIAPGRLLGAIPVGTAAAVLVLLAQSSPVVALLCLGAAGFCYGATIAAYPGVIGKAWPGARGVAVYGVVFTAWGASGVLAPSVAGVLFDRTQSYTLALALAAALAVISALLWRRPGRMFQN